jgi:hypothetical protein
MINHMTLKPEVDGSNPPLATKQINVNLFLNKLIKAFGHKLVTLRVKMYFFNLTSEN